MPLGNLKTTHMYNGEWVSENELRQLTYQANQQAEGKEPRASLEPLPVRKKRKQDSTEEVTDTSTTPDQDEAVFKQAEADLKKRNIH